MQPLSRHWKYIQNLLRKKRNWGGGVLELTHSVTETRSPKTQNTVDLSFQNPLWFDHSKSLNLRFDYMKIFNLFVPFCLQSLPTVWLFYLVAFLLSLPCVI